MNLKPLVVVVGTRAEAIKLIPVYKALQDSNIPVILCATYQHTHLLDDVLDVFQVRPDYNLGIMKENQDLFHITHAVMEKTKQVYEEIKPSLVIVHGDTTTTMAAALAAFYMHIPIAHIEAGLRTGNMYSPFPEELNRKLVGQIATYHFAPTALSTANMLAEGVRRENLFCTGNTVVDALFYIRKKILTHEIEINANLRLIIDEARRLKKKMVLVTAHRRESFNGGLDRIFAALQAFALQRPNTLFFYPFHPNPNVIAAIERSGIKNNRSVLVMPALRYPDLLYLLMAVDFVATDSGGIQEEAVSLGKRVLCLRDVTERHEGVWEGMEIVVGTDEEKIISGLHHLYTLDASARISLVYGDGNACARIVSILKTKLFTHAQHGMGQPLSSILRTNNVHHLM